MKSPHSNTEKSPPRITNARIKHAMETLEAIFPGVKFSVPNRARAKDPIDELWVKDALSFGMAVRFGRGKAGISCTVRKFTGGQPITLTGNDSPDMRVIQQIDAFEATSTVYYPDEYSRAFKAWYGDPRKDLEHPSKRGIKPFYGADLDKGDL